MKATMKQNNGKSGAFGIGSKVRGEPKRKEFFMGKKNVSAIESGAGFIGSLASKLIKRLRQMNISDEDIYELAKEGEASDTMVDKIANALAEDIQQAKNIFRLAIGKKRTTKEAVKAGNYDYANDNINNRNFPMRPRPVGEREIILLEFDYDPSSEQAIAEAEKQGLIRPDHEDALDFGEQFPEKQREHPIVFLHEPWQGPDGGLGVMVLGRSVSSERSLSLSGFRSGWGRHCRFAFVRK